MPKILFATSEVYPLVKTGGLGDVSASLPAALSALGEDVRIVLPGYREALAAAENPTVIASISTVDSQAKLLQTTLPGSSVPVWMVDYPSLFDRPGNPYLQANGTPWSDNAERFAFFSRAVVAVAMARAIPAWRADVLHCNDWQCGLAAALCALESERPAIVFTIHNLAYQGLFSFATFESLNLPMDLWRFDALEFYDQMSFIKGGIVFADRITTVSPNYANEILTPEFGCGLEGTLMFRRARLSGILNGIDEHQWDPENDPLIAKNFGVSTLKNKQANKRTLQREMRLPEDIGKPLLAMITRLVEQKGVDLLIEVLPHIVALKLQLVILGTGDPDYENSLRLWALRYPQQISVHIGFDEGLSHRIEAGADVFLMPSRYEPCGLNQMYSQRYGSIPIVSNVGGLADTVIDANPATLDNGSADGFVFQTASSSALLEAIDRAISLFRDKTQWTQIQKAGMQKDFSWQQSAEQYLDLYQRACKEI